MFCATTFISIWTLKYFQWNNRLPGYDRAQLGSQNIDPDKAAFSLAPHGDEEAYSRVNMADHDHDHDHDHDEHLDGSHYGGGGARSDYSDPYGPAAGSQVGAASTVSSYHDNPFRTQAGGNALDNDTDYNSGRVSAAGSRYAPPTATDPFEDASFPHANYDRIENLRGNNHG